jgi:hypothetical protein
MKRARGWTEEQWTAQVDDLLRRGLLAENGAITKAGSAAVDNAERLTNRLALSPWQSLDDDAFLRVAEAIAPIAHACGSYFPHPNPIGMPLPWHPQSDPGALAISELPA